VILKPGRNPTTGQLPISDDNASYKSRFQAHRAGISDLGGDEFDEILANLALGNGGPRRAHFPGNAGEAQFQWEGTKLAGLLRA